MPVALWSDGGAEVMAALVLSKYRSLSDYIPYQPLNLPRVCCMQQNSKMTIQCQWHMPMVYLPVKWSDQFRLNSINCSLQYLIASPRPNTRRGTSRHVTLVG